MHSAIVVIRMPEQSRESSSHPAWLTFLAEVDRLEGGTPDVLHEQKGVARLAENVWQVNLQENPAALPRLVGAAENMRFPYGVLQLDAPPQWILSDFDSKPT